MRPSGLQGPLQRGPKDFIVLKGEEYVNNKIEVLLSIHSNPWDGTGELEWDQGTGTMIETLRHRNIVKKRLELLTLYLLEQLRLSMPEVTITRVRFEQVKSKNIVVVQVSWAWPRLQTSGSATVEVPT